MTENFLDNAQMRIVRQASLQFSQYEIQQGLPVVSVLETVKTVNDLKFAISQGMGLTEANITTLAASGRLELLKYLKSNQRISIAGAFSLSWRVAKEGHLDVLKWAHENGCPWGESTCSAAADEGHLDVLKWARQNGCPWDESTCKAAAEGGHLECLKWLRNNGCPWDNRTRLYAAERGHHHVLMWALEHGCP
jgi:hypothetical protein